MSRFAIAIFLFFASAFAVSAERPRPLAWAMDAVRAENWLEAKLSGKGNLRYLGRPVNVFVQTNGEGRAERIDPVEEEDAGIPAKDETSPPPAKEQKSPSKKRDQ